MSSSEGVSIPGVGADGLTADVRKYRDGIEIYHIRRYYHKRTGDNTNIMDHTSVGRYDDDGQFRWVGASYQHGPSWLAEATGGYVISKSIGCDQDRPILGRKCVPTGIETTNDHSWGIRGVFMRYQGHTGAFQTEAVRY